LKGRNIEGVEGTERRQGEAMAKNRVNALELFESEQKR
jgi:hypothetical protein